MVVTPPIKHAHRDGETPPSNAFAVQGHHALGGVQHRLDIGGACGDGHFFESQGGVGGLEFVGVGVTHAQSL